MSKVAEKANIAVYVQHYLTPSMTFVYRQIEILKQNFNVFVFCSGKVENTDIFPQNNLISKQRPLFKIKSGRVYNKLFSYQQSLAVNPKLSMGQKEFFKKKIKGNNISIIHAHFGPSAIEVLPIAQELNIPLVVTFHGYDISDLLKFSVYKRNLTRLLKYSWNFIVAESMKQELLKLGASKNRIIVIRCGIPTNKFKFSDTRLLHEKFENKEEIKFVQISNFVEKKGHRYTLKAFAEFIAFYSNAKLVLAGNGALLARCKELVKELFIEDKVVFTGHLVEDEVVKLMKEADVFLHHSITASNGDKEGVPTVIMEAMASGIPVISTYHSGIPELINDGVSGFLVHEKDVEEYLEKMKLIVQNGDKFKLSAKQTVDESFSLDIETDKMKDIFNTIIKANER